jgi:hypothetical protein
MFALLRLGDYFTRASCCCFKLGLKIPNAAHGREEDMRKSVIAPICKIES